MGNTVSAAESVATGMLHPGIQGVPPTKPHGHMSGDISECPMHQKPPPANSSECPVKHDDINPLNMV